MLPEGTASSSFSPMLGFYFLAAIVICVGLHSLRQGFRFADYVFREAARPPVGFAPFASIIAPCRGLDQGLQDNVAALLNQDYPEYEIIFVTDSALDPSLGVISDLTNSIVNCKVIPMRIVIAGDATDSGQKVHNLRRAVGEVNSQSRVLVFVDTDARPEANWLRSLVGPLQDDRVGAATGYRWFIPVTGGFASHTRSVWNSSIASALGEADSKNFCWGGSTAIRRETFDRLEMRDRWRGSVSDDFTLTRVLQEANLAVRFVPSCLTASLEDCSFRELVEFTNRQLKITRVYAPHLWKVVIVGSLLFSLVFFGGAILIALRALSGQAILLPLGLLGVIYLLGAAKALVRLRAVSVPLQSYRPQLRKSLLAHLVLWPVASLLFLYNAVAAAFSRRLRWRGIVYQLNSPTEAVIISRE